MAKTNSKNEKNVNYSEEIKKLKENGPERLYILRGKEDYLREQYLLKLKQVCLPDGEDSFSYKRIDGPELNVNELRAAVDAMPFLTERTFVELRNLDFGKMKPPEDFLAVFSDIPEYCTVAMVLSSEDKIDGKLKLVKEIKKQALDLNFNAQAQGPLINWVVRHFAAAGKSIDLQAVQRLIFISGEYMGKLIPEIDKITAYAKGDKVTVADVEAVANHIPEAQLFDMTDYISKREYNNAAAEMAELLADKNNSPIMLIAVLGAQMRKLYAAKLAQLNNMGTSYVMEVCAYKYDFQAVNLMKSARGFSLKQLKRAVELCAEADYKMKSSSADDEGLLIETMMRIASGEENATN